jgi:hypothetical protein
MKNRLDSDDDPTVTNTDLSLAKKFAAMAT